MATKKSKNQTPLGTHLLAGGTAGLMEALVCHPLDTIKVRMQLSRSGRGGKGVSTFFGGGFFNCRAGLADQTDAWL